MEENPTKALLMEQSPIQPVEQPVAPAELPPGDFRRPDEVSWRTSLIVPPGRMAIITSFCAGEEKARSVIAMTALSFGYQFVVIAPQVFEVKPPIGESLEPSLFETEMLVENGSFVAYVVHQDLTPLCVGGQPVFFVNPAVARTEAARNAGEVLRSDEWAIQARKAAESRIVQLKAGGFPKPSIFRG